jgi:hypothetical protein
MGGWRLEYLIDVDEENRIVYEKIFGIFRPETAVSYKEDFEEKVAPIIDKPWVKLIDLNNWKPSYPEIIETIGDHLLWCKDHNMVWSVNIINNKVTYSQLMKMFSQGMTREISRTFRKMEDGEAFLKEQGFPVNPDFRGK